MLCYCDDMHWSLYVVYPHQKTVEEYNSAGTNVNALWAVFNWYRDNCHQQQITINDEEWKLLHLCPNIPQQNDTNSCGLWTAFFALCVGVGMDPRTVNIKLFTDFGWHSFFALFYHWLRLHFMEAQMISNPTEQSSPIFCE